ncbi:hypothetical protein SAICODRAFT_25329 [Saitoella complicata NRRL Y-17804]|uniref:uncharacterized protein n=1 Tax=Saitoella complicata (strain BCRC 22490 / CBS 7301 / JCM 7358 / NBRC 10748 / NRRL Y-17804) TaxID=698492 RepID=UPI0008672E86|nr:uncharacterized protein SAICODRAFT_25329 [Saitoella complicata NRRL Y-17804]ODQ53245.1 hypothetical protein SAICODRAFT_25329 [Saitoella complicata NRRL Y-17804]
MEESAGASVLSNPLLMSCILPRIETAQAISVLLCTSRSVRSATQIALPTASPTKLSFANLSKLKVKDLRRLGLTKWTRGLTYLDVSGTGITIQFVRDVILMVPYLERLVIRGCTKVNSAALSAFLGKFTYRFPPGRPDPPASSAKHPHMKRLTSSLQRLDCADIDGFYVDETQFAGKSQFYYKQKTPYLSTYHGLLAQMVRLDIGFDVMACLGHRQGCRNGNRRFNEPWNGISRLASYKDDFQRVCKEGLGLNIWDLDVHMMPLCDECAADWSAGIQRCVSCENEPW